MKKEKKLEVKKFNVIKKNVKEFEKLTQELKSIKEEYDSLNERLKETKKNLMQFFIDNELLSTDMKGVMSNDMACEVIYRKDSTTFDDATMEIKAPNTYAELLKNYGKTVIDLDLIKVKAPNTYAEIIEKYSIVTRKGSYAIGEVQDMR